MPIIAVAGIVAGGSALAAGAVGMAAVMAGATMVGGALSLVGQITGNERLTKIGGIIGTVGGIGMGLSSMANAGGLGDVTAGVTGGDAINVGAHFSDAAMDAGTLGSTAVTAGLPEAGTSILSSAQQPTQLQPKSDALSGYRPQQSLGKMSLSQQTPANIATNQIDPDAPFVTNSKFADAPDAFTSADKLQSGKTSFLDKAKLWMKDNPELAKTGLQGIQGVAGNLITSPVDQARIDLANQEVEDKKRRALWATGRM